MADLELISDFVNTAELEEQRDDFAHARGLVRWLAAHRLANAHTAQGSATPRGARRARGAAGAAAREQRDRGRSRPRVATLDAAARRAGLAVRFENGAIRSFRGGGVHGGSAVLAAVAEAMADGSWRGSRRAGRTTAAGRSSTRRATGRGSGATWASAATGRRRAVPGAACVGALRVGAPLFPAAAALGVSFGVLARTAHFGAAAAIVDVGDDVRRLVAGRGGLRARRAAAGSRRRSSRRCS